MDPANPDTSAEIIRTALKRGLPDAGNYLKNNVFHETQYAYEFQLYLYKETDPVKQVLLYEYYQYMLTFFTRYRWTN